MTVDEFADRLLNPAIAKAQAEGRLPQDEIPGPLPQGPTVAQRVEALERRVLELEARLVIQTGTVFGAQGDSDPMTIEHMIPEPPLNEWKA